MGAFEKFRSADKLFWDSSGTKIEKIFVSQFKSKYWSARGLEILEKYYSQYSIDVFDEENINKILEFHSFNGHYTHENIYEALKAVQKEHIDYVVDYLSYKNCLKAYYGIHGKDTEWLVKLFVERYDLERFAIEVEDVLDDLHEIMDTTAEIPSLKKNSNSSVKSKEQTLLTSDMSDMRKNIENSIFQTSAVIETNINDTEEFTLFLMEVEDVFVITGGGIVATGTITSGEVKFNDKLFLRNHSDKEIEVTVRGIELYRKRVDTAIVGDSVGLLLKGVEKDDICQGDILTNDTVPIEFQKAIFGMFVSDTPIYNTLDLSDMGEFHAYVTSYGNEQLISAIKTQYLTFKNTCKYAPALGTNGCLEFAGGLLLSIYMIEKVNKAKTDNSYSKQQIKTLCDELVSLMIIIFSAFLGATPTEWSNMADKFAENSSFLTKREWSIVYLYLRDNHADDIRKMEFNAGNSYSHLVDRKKTADVLATAKGDLGMLKRYFVSEGLLVVW